MQSVVYAQQGFGVPGEFYDDSPRRARAYTLKSADPAYNVIGRAFSQDALEGKAGAGGAGLANVGTFAGILVNPKSYATSGTALGGALAPTLTLRNGEIAELATMGRINVILPAAAAIGDRVAGDTVTGALATAPRLASFTGVIAVTTGVLTVSGIAAGGYLAPGVALSGANVPGGTVITSQIGGTTGGNGTYQTNIITAVASTAMTANNSALAIGANYVFIPNATVFAYTVDSAGLAVIQLTD